MLQYTIDACGGIDTFAMTHLDVFPSQRGAWICHAHEDLGRAQFPIGAYRPSLAKTHSLFRKHGANIS